MRGTLAESIFTSSQEIYSHERTDEIADSRLQDNRPAVECADAQVFPLLRIDFSFFLASTNFFEVNHIHYRIKSSDLSAANAFFDIRVGRVLPTSPRTSS